VKILLDNGADVNAQGGQYGSALQAAAHFPFSCHQELIFGAEKLVVPEKIKYPNVNTKY
jgi:hypothetical protein